MKKKEILLFTLIAGIFVVACNDSKNESQITATNEVSNAAGQEAVVDDESAKDIVKIASGSPDHSTLVAALKEADYVNDLTNAGPFTVFAPTNEAFVKLPAGTLDNLMKKENVAALQNILQYHVSIGVFKENMLQDGQVINQANLDNITINKSVDGKIKINNKANVIATIPASNGLIYVIDEVLLPTTGNN